MKKMIFWDNDGVLVDTEKYYFKATQIIFASMDIELTEKDYKEYFLKQALGTWHFAKDKGIKENIIEAKRQERNDLYNDYLRKVPLEISGARKTLESLYNKISMGIVTSSSKEHFETIHNRTGFTKYFDFTLAMGDYEKSKPDPDPYLKALKISQRDPEECVVIEDSERGLMAAKAAGLDCWVIPTDLTKDGDFHTADKILKNISQVQELFQ